MLKISNVNISRTEKMNRGEYSEYVFAASIGVTDHKKDSIAYNLGSDIEANGFGYSVKSKGATLTELLTTTEKSDNGKRYIIDTYLKTTHSNRIAYVTDDVTYILDMNEFERMMWALWSLDEGTRKNKGRYKLRIKRADSSVIKWLEGNL